MRACISFGLAVIIGFGCAPAADDGPATADTTVAYAMSQRGLYVFGHEVESFHPCGDTASYWALLPAHRSKWLRATRDSLVTEPYEPVFVEVFGEISSEPTDGFAEAYAAYFNIDSIVSVRRAQPGDCRMAEFSTQAGTR